MYEKKKYLKKHIDILSIEDRKSIGNILIVENLKKKLIWCSEGTAINLDSLEDKIINSMYFLMEYKINKMNR